MERGKTSVDEAKRVMVAIDENEGSLYALEWALKNLHESIANSEFVILTVQPSSAFNYLRLSGGTKELKDDVEEHHQKTASSLLEKAKDISHKYQVTPKTVTGVGDPKDAIREAVEKYNIDLLVIGSHGEGALKRAFLGSVSNYCMNNVKCPVLVVKKQT